MSSSTFHFPRCLCTEEDSLFTVENILQCQKASDFLISLAYFSIPLELFYFVSCSTIFPFRWILLQFGAFIVLCGLTHLLNVWTYDPHSFHLMLSLTVLKFLTALVSCATSITLATLLPQMLRVMVREGLLRKKTRELGREVGMMKRQEEASWHVRMLTHEIRRSLDRHTILYTTLVQLAHVLFLENCSVWMPEDDVEGEEEEATDRRRLRLILTHELKRSDGSDRDRNIPICDPDVLEVVGRKEPVVLGPDSALRRGFERGPAAAVRLPLLKVSNFKGGTPEVVEARYAVLVLVLPGDGKRWGTEELEIVEVVADQVAVALSHAAVLEESVRMREKLMERNMDLKLAGQKALLASEARVVFRKFMSREMAAPVRSLSAILSLLQRDGNLKSDQRRIVDGMVRGSLLLSSLIEDALEDASSSESRLELGPFSLHSLMKEAVGIARLLCTFRGLSLDVDFVKEEVPDAVIGDEKRVLKAFMYMVGNVASYGGDRGNVLLRVCRKGGSRGNFDPNNLAWKQPISEEFMQLNFEVTRISSSEDVSCILEQRDGECMGNTNAEGLSLAVCKKLAQLMYGSISVSTNPQGEQMNMNLTIRLQVKRSMIGLPRPRYIGPKTPESLLNGMNVLLADGDSFNLSITRKLLGQTGCHLTVVSTWYQCLENLHHNGNKYQLLLIDLDILEENIHEVCALVRRLQSESWFLVVALTSNADRDTRNRCLQNGMNGVISKPVIWQEMAVELQRVIQKFVQVPSPPLHTDLQS
eukprot:TRINITY_DN4659_c1_g1_i1.p1 TRINITY_DN4659_c1_g1~~TRINITY_DN4659_c1_g1_i1.p1  ORF type:complete len:759 (-),score=119.27 TRINITY_DN4659_c1_g1_i1:768-3044(-)